MRIAVFGCGGVGAYFGGRLAQIGQDVTFIARNENLSALRTQGLKVGSIAGDFILDKVKASSNPADVGVVDYVLCGVKAWQVTAAARAIQPMVGPDTLVVPLQNGVEAPDQLAAILDPANVLGGLCAIIAFQAGPGHIKHSGGNPLIRFGHLDNRADPRINALSEVFNRCIGVKSSIPKHHGGDVAEIHADHALERPRRGIAGALGVLLEQPETRELLTEATGSLPSAWPGSRPARGQRQKP